VIETVIGRHHEADVDLATTDHDDAALALLRFSDLAMFPSAMPGAAGWAEADLHDIKEQLLPRMPSWLWLDAVQLKEIIAQTTAETDTTVAALGVG
jgi:hypothetical protein